MCYSIAGKVWYLVLLASPAIDAKAEPGLGMLGYVVI
jgi:hypothetical protein